MASATRQVIKEFANMEREGTKRFEHQGGKGRTGVLNLQILIILIMLELFHLMDCVLRVEVGGVEVSQLAGVGDGDVVETATFGDGVTGHGNVPS